MTPQECSKEQHIVLDIADDEAAHFTEDEDGSSFTHHSAQVFANKLNASRAPEHRTFAVRVLTSAQAPDQEEMTS